MRGPSAKAIDALGGTLSQGLALRAPQRKPTVADLRGKTLRSELVTSMGNANKLESDELEPLELLGQGAYGMVHRVQEKTTGQYRVMKTVVRPNGWDDERLKLEAEILQNLDHPHILRIFAWYEEGDSINIVMEHCTGGELLKTVRDGKRNGEEMPESWGCAAIRQSFEALVYIHAKGVVHKDLKSQNLLLLHMHEEDERFVKAPHVVVCDLGIAEVMCCGIFGMRGNKVAGTPATMAPEVWKGNCGPKSDVWSMGCVMFELFTNRLPFELSNTAGMDQSRMQAKWLELHKKGPRWELMKTSKDAVEVNKFCLTIKETSRPTAAECLKHKWFGMSIDRAEQAMTKKELQDMYEAVCAWQSRSPMQKAMCLKIAVGCTRVSNFARLFSKFDTDNSGVLDRAEVVAALLDIGFTRTMAKSTAQALDVNGDNSCEYLEFVAACLPSLKKEFDELLKQEFKTLDRKCIGHLDNRQIESLMVELRPLAAAHGLVLQDIDENGDGVISFSEFCLYFGRPGVKYVDGDLQTERTDRDEERAMQNSKSHIRIVTNQDGMEKLKMSMEASMEASSERKRVSNPSERNRGSKNRRRSSSRRAEELDEFTEMKGEGGGSSPSVQPRPSQDQTAGTGSTPVVQRRPSKEETAGTGSTPSVRRRRPSKDDAVNATGAPSDEEDAPNRSPRQPRPKDAPGAPRNAFGAPSASGTANSSRSPPARVRRPGADPDAAPPPECRPNEGGAPSPTSPLASPRKKPAARPKAARKKSRGTPSRSPSVAPAAAEEGASPDPAVKAEAAAEEGALEGTPLNPAENAETAAVRKLDTAGEGSGAQSTPQAPRAAAHAASDDGTADSTASTALERRRHGRPVALGEDTAVLPSAEALSSGGAEGSGNGSVGGGPVVDRIVERIRRASKERNWGMQDADDAPQEAVLPAEGETLESPRVPQAQRRSHMLNTPPSTIASFDRYNQATASFERKVGASSCVPCCTIGGWLPLSDTCRPGDAQYPMPGLPESTPPSGRSEPTPRLKVSL